MLGISIGSVHKIVGDDKDRNEYIKYIRDCGLKFEAIELNALCSDFRLTNDNRTYLDTMKHVSIHLPVVDYDFWKVLQQYDFKYWVGHSDVNYNDEDLIEIEDDDIMLIENLDAETLLKIPENYFNELIENFDICFDISHELSKGLDLCKFNLAMYKDKIKEIHISGYNKKCHVPFYYGTLLEIAESLKRNNLLELPIIMEYNFDSFDEMEQEYNLLKEALCIN